MNALGFVLDVASGALLGTCAYYVARYAVREARTALALRRIPQPAPLPPALYIQPGHRVLDVVDIALWELELDGIQ